MINEKRDRAADRLAQTLVRREDVVRAHQVDKAIDSQGRPIISGRDFLELVSPDGSVWRLRIDNAGNLIQPATKVAP